VAKTVRLGRRVRVIAAIAIAACSPPGQRSAIQPELRVMSWNIQAGGKGIDSIAAVIRAIDPDIIGLQEVDVHWSERSGFADQAQELASRLGLRVMFAPIYSVPSAEAAKPLREFGVAVLTRHRVVQWRNDSLTRLSTQTTNPVPASMPGLLRATIDIRGRSVQVLTTHLDYRADPAVRQKQVAEVLRYLTGSQMPSIVVGDMNAAPDAPELSPLLASLRDAWGGRGGGFTYPAENPTKRIDYVLTSSHFSPLSAVVVETTVSDHRPVLARLILH
jgi:endonuclease/exonuclease/phosphatase family metal-dependent hydrolase